MVCGWMRVPPKKQGERQLSGDREDGQMKIEGVLKTGAKTACAVGGAAKSLAGKMVKLSQREKPVEISRPHVAVLYDADNVGFAHLAKVVDRAKAMGRVSTVRVYGPGNLLTSEAGEKASYAVRADRILPEGFIAGKNSTDIRIAVDAVELALLADFDVFVVVSRDSDFTPVAQRLKLYGKRVVGMAPSAGNGFFAKACDQFIELGSCKVAESGAYVETIDDDVLALLKKCVRETGGPEGWSDLSKVGNRLREERKGFSPRNYNCANLTRLLERAGSFELSTGNNGIGYVRLRAAA